MPKIVASAIKFYSQDNEYPVIVCGKRHCDCFEWMYNHQIKYDKKTHQQGFLTDQNQFINRYEAMCVAMNNGQIPYDLNKEGKELYSEDIFPIEKNDTI
jgi:hypothetical protein